MRVVSNYRCDRRHRSSSLGRRVHRHRHVRHRVRHVHLVRFRSLMDTARPTVILLIRYRCYQGRLSSVLREMAVEIIEPQTVDLHIEIDLHMSVGLELQSMLRRDR